MCDIKLPGQRIGGDPTSGRNEQERSYKPVLQGKLGSFGKMIGFGVESFHTTRTFESNAIGEAIDFFMLTMRTRYVFGPS